ncbi:ribosome maturation factor RimM [Magnetospirillum molischianum]|uniref:Ribosome maturation factor RimM n=1 Tax=Magnetospirillum molischianum DSM 120 TaxID=1150626 RepID=H8FRT9_MAGML|nr:ribosome maturation factor RimM [Magnetospirillum molischianum]CCG41077.1 16S rRNA processing protein, putative function [Magnetospirillum molischianum DSM 120]
MSSRVCVGIVVGAQGVRGAVRVKSFTEDPVDIGRYSPVEDEGGSRKLRMVVVGEAKGVVIATLDGISDRNAAEALRGTRLYVDRDRLPGTDEDEFLYSDLIGMVAEAPDGTRLGTIASVGDFGAGDVLEITLADGGAMMVPFSRADVPVVDVAGRRLVVVPPVYAIDENEDKEASGRRD